MKSQANWVSIFSNIFWDFHNGYALWFLFSKKAILAKVRSLSLIPSLPLPVSLSLCCWYCFVCPEILFCFVGGVTILCFTFLCAGITDVSHIPDPSRIFKLLMLSYLRVIIFTSRYPLSPPALLLTLFFPASLHPAFTSLLTFSLRPQADSHPCPVFTIAVSMSHTEDDSHALSVVLATF